MQMWVLFRASNQDGRISISLRYASCGLGRCSGAYRRNQFAANTSMSSLGCSHLQHFIQAWHFNACYARKPFTGLPNHSGLECTRDSSSGLHASTWQDKLCNFISCEFPNSARWSSRDIISVISKHWNWQRKTRTSNRRPTNIKYMHDRCEAQPVTRPRSRQWAHPLSHYIENTSESLSWAIYGPNQGWTKEWLRLRFKSLDPIGLDIV